MLIIMSTFFRYLCLNWEILYVKTGVAVWLTKAGIDTKTSLDEYKSRSGPDFERAILEDTAKNVVYYLPNVLFWPAGFAIDGYKWGVIEYYKHNNNK